MMKCVLIVDDEPAIVTGMQLRAASDGWQTFPAYDGVNGLKLAKARRPQLIILDVKMPGLDGLQTLAAIRQDPETSEIPVLMMSGSNDDRQTAFEAGADAFLLKPHRMHDFLQALSRFSTGKPDLAPTDPHF